MNIPKLAVIDLDGTIADDNHRKSYINHFAVTLDDKYREYHSRCGDDPVINRYIVDDHIGAGNKIIFNTSRPEEFRNMTWSWLARNFKLPIDTLLIMRPNDNHQPSFEIKPKLIKQHIDKFLGSYESVVAYDDKASVINGYQKIGINDLILVAEGTLLFKKAAIGTVNIAGDKVGEITSIEFNPAPAGSVPQLLRQAADTFEQRNALYGSAYKNYGTVMMGLFPDGLEIYTSDDWNRFGVLSMIVSKLNRYASNLTQGGHQDSAHDMAVYAAMLEELTK